MFCFIIAPLHTAVNAVVIIVSIQPYREACIHYLIDLLKVMRLYVEKPQAEVKPSEFNLSERQATIVSVNVVDNR